MTNALWAHQQRAIGQLRASLRAGKRHPLVYSPTGSGKTTIAGEIARLAREKDKRIAFTVPAISIVDQTVASFWHHGVKDVGVIQADHNSTDWAKPVQVCSLDTLTRRDAFPKVDMVIVDEAHVIKKGLLKWMEMRPDMPFIGLSATPWRRGLGQLFDDLIIAATITELQAAGILVKTRTFAPSHPDLTGVRTTAGEFNAGDLARKATQKALTGDVVETWLAHADRVPTFCFAVDLAHAQLLHERFKDAGVSSAYIDHTMSLKERNSIQRDLARGNIEVICNVDCLGLGTDIPEVCCISYARPTKSITRWVQNIGRGLRSCQDKTDCLILDHSDTTLRLGFIEDMKITELDDGRPRRKTASKAPLPKVCPKCAFVKPPRVQECPRCGFVTERKTAARTRDGQLVEIDEATRKSLVARRKADLRFTEEEKLIVWRMLVGHGRRHGYKDGWASNKYREFFKVWPKGSTPVPMEPSPEIANWIKSQQIRWARSKRRNMEARA